MPYGITRNDGLVLARDAQNNLGWMASGGNVTTIKFATMEEVQSTIFHITQMEAAILAAKQDNAYWKIQDTGQVRYHGVDTSVTPHTYGWTTDLAAGVAFGVKSNCDAACYAVMNSDPVNYSYSSTTY